MPTACFGSSVYNAAACDAGQVPILTLYILGRGAFGLHISKAKSMLSLSAQLERSFQYCRDSWYSIGLPREWVTTALEYLSPQPLLEARTPS